ncbi:MAG: flagellin lysine-N-methylase [Clostridiales bacterium]|nr:flagellin lysine-N-methylase [Clostridiales bacterium]
MKETHEYLVPRYFREFSCKMGACRRSCCEGWPVTVSMKNYFTLLGLPCRKELRDRLDTGLRVLDHPTEEEYARFSPNWLGDCPMRMEDGRCSIHAELGEENLSDVCRLYPRGVRTFDGEFECALSNSCEGVVELLRRERDPMTWERERLPLTPPPFPGTPSDRCGYPASWDARLGLLSILEDRTGTLPERIFALRAPLGLSGMQTTDTQSDGLRAACRLLGFFAERSESIRDEAEACLARYEASPARYADDCRLFADRFPDHAVFFEQLIVNHAFFTQFPYEGLSAADEWKGLAAVYGLLRVLCVGCTAPDPGEDTLADCAASAFRLIDHTRFSALAARLLDEGSAAALLAL